MRLYLAPLLGLVSQDFWQPWEEHFSGLDRIYGPFITLTSDRKPSGRSLSNFKTKKLPFVPQFLGDDPSLIVDHLEFWREAGYDLVNWNLGCPYPRITKGRYGSALLEDPSRLDQSLDKILSRYQGHLGVKIRLASETKKDLALLSLLKQYPLEEIILHPRKATDFYQGTPNKEAFGEYHQVFGDRLVWSGEVWTAEEAWELEKEFPDLSIMLGRGLVADPTLAQKINRTTGEMTPIEIKSFFSELVTVHSTGRIKEFSKLWRRHWNPAHELWEGLLRSQSKQEILEHLDRLLW